MRCLSRFFFAGFLGLLTLPVQGAGRENAAGQPAHASFNSAPAHRVSTHAPKPPKPPSVGGAAPAPVTVSVHKTAAVSTTTGFGAGAAVDDDPVQDFDPVSDSPIGYVSPSTAIAPVLPSYDEIASRNSRINSGSAPHAADDVSATTSTRQAPPNSDTLWSQINAASSHMQAVLSTQPQYRAAVARLASAQQKIAALRAGGQKDPDQIRLAARKVTEAQDELFQMQKSALETDPNFQAALTRNEPSAAVGE